MLSPLSFPTWSTKRATFSPSLSPAFLAKVSIILSFHSAFTSSHVSSKLNPLVDLEGLNTWYDRIKVAAPTRPHPDGPKSAIGNLAVGNSLCYDAFCIQRELLLSFVAPVVTFIDKFRDLAKKFPST